MQSDGTFDPLSMRKCRVDGFDATDQCAPLEKRNLLLRRGTNWGACGPSLGSSTDDREMLSAPPGMPIGIVGIGGLCFSLSALSATRCAWRGGDNVPIGKVGRALCDCGGGV